MTNFENRHGVAPYCGRAPIDHAFQILKANRASASLLIALLSSAAISSSALAQTVTQGQPAQSVGPIVVDPPRPKPAPAISAGDPRTRSARRAAGRKPAPAAVISPTNQNVTAPTPLNTNAVTDVGSRLGITARQTPATVEVINQQRMEELGVRTTSDVAKAAVGVISGDAPGAPAIFSMRGFTGDQISTLYNGIPIGPSAMTGRPMETANLQQVEIIKGPDSLVAGLGAPAAPSTTSTRPRIPGRS